MKALLTVSFVNPEDPASLSSLVTVISTAHQRLKSFLLQRKSYMQTSLNPRMRLDSDLDLLNSVQEPFEAEARLNNI
jgi:hypothetical protein